MAIIDETVARSTIARHLRDANRNWNVDEEAPITKMECYEVRLTCWSPRAVVRRCR